MFRSLRRTTLVLVTTCSLITLAVAAQAITCVKTSGRCTSTTTAHVFTGSPTIVCLNNYDVLEITSSASCPSGNAGPVTVLRCGALADHFSYEGGGWHHEFGPKVKWQGVLSSCDNLKYSPSKL